MLFNKKITVAAVLLMGLWVSTSAQEYRLPDSHAAEHRNLIAEQSNINDKIKVEDTKQFLDDLLNDEEAEPEIDIYTIR